MLLKRGTANQKSYSFLECNEPRPFEKLVPIISATKIDHEY